MNCEFLDQLVPQHQPLAYLFPPCLSSCEDNFRCRGSSEGCPPQLLCCVATPCHLPEVTMATEFFLALLNLWFDSLGTCVCVTVGMTGLAWLADGLAELAGDADRRNTHLVGFGCAHVYSPMSFFLLYDRGFLFKPRRQWPIPICTTTFAWPVDCLLLISFPSN